MNTLYIALVVAVIGPVILSALQGKQRKSEKEQDYKRQDDVANEAKRSADEVATQAAKAARLLSDQQAETTKQAENVAKLLLAAQSKTKEGTDEVARLAASSGGVSSKGMVAITLSYPNENREDIFLAEVPRVGENVRLSNGPERPWLVVEHVLWIEGITPPHVIVSVRSRADGFSVHPHAEGSK